MNTENKELEVLAQELEQAQTDAVEWKDKCARIAADFENYKRRAQQDLSSWTFAAQKRVFEDLLPVIDNFERAIEQLHAQKAEKDSWTDGIIMIHQELKKLLEKNNVQVISLQGEFNPELHEALVQVDSDEYASGMIVQTLQKGYMIGDRVLRPAKVSVAK